MANLPGKGWTTISADVGAPATLVAAVASSQAHVRIVCGNGSPHELAHTIHALSRRFDRPLVCFDCDGLPESLVHSELLGHVAGAFAGAFRPHRGCVWKADHGTLVLVGADSLTPEFQATLYRCIESGDVWPLGATASAGRVDVRLLELVQSHSSTVPV